MSVIDEKLNDLDPTIWGRSIDRSHVIRPEVASQIRHLARQLLRGTPVRAAYLVGSLVGYRYTPRSDVDISLVVDSSDEGMIALVDDAINNINGQRVVGTKHPINFFLTNDPVSLARFDGVYNLKTDTWKKIPEDSAVDLFVVYENFRESLAEIDAKVAEAWRSIIDIKLLKEALKYGGTREIYSKISRRLRRLDEAVTEIVAEYDEIHLARVDAFRRQLDLAEMGQANFPSPNLIPENVRYKLLERYHYVDFMTKLGKLLDESGGRIDTPQDVARVREILPYKDTEDLDFANGFIGRALGSRRL